MKGTKLTQIYSWISVITLHPLYKKHDTKRKPVGCIVYSHYQTNIENVYIAATACLVIMLLSLLVYSGGQLRVKSQKVCISFEHSKSWYLLLEKFVDEF